MDDERANSAAAADGRQVRMVSALRIEVSVETTARAMVAFLSLLLSGCCHVCEVAPPQPAQQAPDVSLVVAGEYEVRFVAKAGSRAGACTTGRLWLHQATARDRSPRTGEGPWVHEHRRGIRYYGAIDFDHQAIGAPIYPGKDSGTTILPSSRDPIYPGVLAVAPHRMLPAATLELRIGSSGNARNGTIVLDGDGMALVVLSATKEGFSGEWGPAGVMADGTGVFCAKRLRER